jgi:hypothetical protein
VLEVIVEGDVAELRMSTSFAVATGLAGTAFAIVGWFVRRRNPLKGWGMMLLFAPLLLAASVNAFLRRTAVTETGFEHFDGLPLIHRFESVAFGDLDRLRVFGGSVTTARGFSQPYYDLEFRLRSGQVVEVRVRETQIVQALYRRLKRLGVPIAVEGETFWLPY